MDPIVEAQIKAYPHTYVQERALTEEEQSKLKMEINNLIWMYSPEGLTLGDADKLALKILGQIMGGS